MLRIICSQQEFDILKEDVKKLTNMVKDLHDRDPRLDIILEHARLIVVEEPITNADVLLDKLLDNIDAYAESRIDHDLSDDRWCGDFDGWVNTKEEAIKAEIEWLNKPVEVKSEKVVK